MADNKDRPSVEIVAVTQEMKAKISENATKKGGLKAEEKDDEHSDTGEILIHAMIETIEFVLGGIAHTASYLRLWALSLAHSQLAKVFFNMIVGPFQSFGSWFLFIGVQPWLVVTILVLMLMDTMECCLHAGRLHW